MGDDTGVPLSLVAVGGAVLLVVGVQGQLRRDGVLQEVHRAFDVGRVGPRADLAPVAGGREVRADELVAGLDAELAEVEAGQFLMGLVARLVADVVEAVVRALRGDRCRRPER